MLSIGKMEVYQSVCGIVDFTNKNNVSARYVQVDLQLFELNRIITIATPPFLEGPLAMNT